MLYGDIIDKEIVFYDESLNFYNPAYYDLALNTIVTKGIDPVDPGGLAPYYMKYFKRISWTSRTGVWSLSLTPKDGNVGEESQVWNSIKTYFSHDSQWARSGNSTVDSSMYNQYKCHLDFSFTGMAGPTWDLEPSKPDKGYAGFVASMCN